MTKPPFKLPSMADVAAVPPNGFTYVGTFAGCGGSCLGFKLVGYRTRLAVEFVPAAAETYRLNFPGVPVIERDIRQVTGDDILRATGLAVGELDAIGGSPPCSSYSAAGAGSRNWGKSKNYSGIGQRTDDLWPHFVRLVDQLQPRCFVGENVASMTRGHAKGAFLETLAALKGCGYRVAARVLDAAWLGVPQSRKRLIFVGVRNDLGLDPVHPRPLAYQYTLRDAVPWIDKSAENPFPVEPETDMSRYAVGREWKAMGRPGTTSSKYFSLVRPQLDRPVPTLTATTAQTGAAGLAHPLACRKFSVAEAKRLSGFPDDFRLSGSYSEQVERLGRCVPPPMMYHVAATIRDQILRRIK